MTFEFGLSISTCEQTGEILSCYFKIRHGSSYESREFADGAAVADYDKNGYLIGIELLSPCRVSVVNRIAANESHIVRQKTKDFMRDNGPRSLIAA